MVTLKLLGVQTVFTGLTPGEEHVVEHDGQRAVAVAPTSGVLVAEVRPTLRLIAA